MITASDYLSLFNIARVSPDANSQRQLDYVCRVALANQPQYQTVQNAVKVPWPLIAAIHFRESNQSFTCHLHNGDPLLARTVRVPAGRPVAGNPPFTWPDSACDAFSRVWRPSAWDIASCLAFVERYNGTGYQKHAVNTPYLWDFTDQYTSGLFVSDGSFDPAAKESRPGAVAILKTLESKGVSLDFSALGVVGSLLH